METLQKGKDMRESGSYNPIPRDSWRDSLQLRQFDLGFYYSYRGIVDTNGNGEGIYGFNFNPYLTDKCGNKVYFQRGFCWSLEDKRNFIDALYNDMNCGDILLRWNSVERRDEVKAEFDVIDGKQRISALCEFFGNGFSDWNGYCWKDFSEAAQRFMKAKCKSLTTYILDEHSSDAVIKRAFLNVNFTGVPMSKEHIEFVKSIDV